MNGWVMKGGLIKMTSIQRSDGITLIMSDNSVVINGVEYFLPGRGCNSTIIDGKVFVNGYELKNGKWKKTIKAIFHKYF